MIETEQLAGHGPVHGRRNGAEGITDMSLTDEDGLDIPDPAAHPEVIIAAD